MKMFWKKKKPKINTVLHPAYKRLVEKVATISGRDIYMFKDILDMPINRYNAVTRFSSEYNLRIDAKMLSAAIKKLIEHAESEKIKRAKILGILLTLEAQTEMLVSMDLHYRLASGVCFWIDEDLTDYDYAVGDEKIRLMKTEDFDDFFLSEPVKRIMPQLSISPSDLAVLSQSERELKNLLSLQLNEQSKSAEKTI